MLRLSAQTFRNILPFTAGGLLWLLVAGIVLADEKAIEPSAAPSSTESPSTEPALPALGSTIFVDPVTGELTNQPTPQQEAQMVDAMRRQHKKALGRDGFEPTPFALPGGGEGVFLDDLVVSAIVLVKDEKGHWIETCGDGDITIPHIHTSSDETTDGSQDQTLTSSAPVM